MGDDEGREGVRVLSESGEEGAELGEDVKESEARSLGCSKRGRERLASCSSIVSSLRREEDRPETHSQPLHLAREPFFCSFVLDQIRVVLHHGSHRRRRLLRERRE